MIAPQIGRIRILFSDAVVYTLGVVLNQGLRFLALPIIAKTLSPAEIGAYDAARLLVVIGGPMVALGMESAVAILYHEKCDDSKRRQIASTGLITVTLFALITSVLIIIMQNSFYHWLLGGKGSKAILWAGVALLCIVPSAEFCRNLLRWQLRRLPYVVLLVGESFITIIIGFYMVVVAKAGVLGWMLAIFIGSSITLLAGLVINRRLWILSLSRNLICHLIRIGFPFALVSISIYLTPMVTRLALVHLTGLTDVGLFGVADRISMLIGFIAIGFQSAWGPFYLSRQRDSDASHLFGKAALYYSIIALWMSVGTILLGKSLIALFTSAEYESASRMIVPLIITRALAGLDFVIMGGIYIKKKSYHLIWIYLLSSLVTLGLNILIVPQFGGWTAGWIIMIAKLLSICLMFIVSQKLFPVIYERRQFIPLSILGVLFLATATWLNIHTLSSAWLQGIISLAVFAAAVLLTSTIGIIPKDDMVLISRFIRQRMIKIKG